MKRNLTFSLLLCMSLPNNIMNRSSAFLVRLIGDNRPYHKRSAPARSLMKWRFLTRDDLNAIFHTSVSCQRVAPANVERRCVVPRWVTRGTGGRRALRSHRAGQIPARSTTAQNQSFQPEVPIAGAQPSPTPRQLLHFGEKRLYLSRQLRTPVCRWREMVWRGVPFRSGNRIQKSRGPLPVSDRG